MIWGENGSTLSTDLVVLGSGAGGMTAALTAALGGLKVIVLEHADVIGGTSARSSGTVWVPNNHLMLAAGMVGDDAASARYLASLTDDTRPDALWRVFLAQAPMMLRELESHAGIKFRSFLSAPDYRQDISGAAIGGRALEPLSFDGRLLGNDFKRLATPLPELMLFSGMMITRSEAASLLKADRSLKSLALGIKLTSRYMADRFSYKRGTRLVLGNALVARLFKTCLDHGVLIRTGVKASKLIRQDGAIVGIQLREGDAVKNIISNRGVVLAGGGFPASPDWRAAQLPAPVSRYTPAAPGCDGSTLDLALAVGAVLGPGGKDNGLWFPSSIATRKDGSVAVYPHIVLDRAKPGLIAVNQAGDRFTNEAASYHQFVRAMYEANAASPAIPAWLICDRVFLHRYGLGMIRPRATFLGRYLRSGYLKQGHSIGELAGAIGMLPERLGVTVSRANRSAEAGIDHDFGKGNSLYDRSNGDAAVGPNPCLGRIETAPFFAVAVYPTPLGTSRGLVADAESRALDAAGTPIRGLYVCGNDMQSAFNGEYPGAGAQLGQAMTFGWIAGRHAKHARNP